MAVLRKIWMLIFIWHCWFIFRIEAKARKNNIKEVKITATAVNCALHACENCHSQILVDDVEYAPGVDGLNLVVVDHKSGRVTQTKGILNTYSKEFKIFVDSVKNGDIVLSTSQVLCNKRTGTDTSTQSFILKGFKGLGAPVDNLSPVAFRSGIYIFCKSRCATSLSSKLPLPIWKLQKSDRDPVLLSFTIDILNFSGGGVRSPRGGDVEKKDGGVTSYSETPAKESSTITVLVVLLIILMLIGMSVMLFFYIRLQRKTRQQHQQQGLSSDQIKHLPPPQRTTRANRRELNENAAHFCECKRQQQQQQYAGAMTSRKTSCVLPRDNRVTLLPKRHHSDVCASKSDRLVRPASFRHFVSRDVGDVIEEEKNFATYVSLPEDEEDEAIYKAPSNVFRHAPPVHPPPTFEKIPEENSRVADHQHEYEEPGVGPISENRPPWETNRKAFLSDSVYPISQSGRVNLTSLTTNGSESDDRKALLSTTSLYPSSQSGNANITSSPTNENNSESYYGVANTSSVGQSEPVSPAIDQSDVFTEGYTYTMYTFQESEYMKPIKQRIPADR